jgi:hypothetical protein
MKLTVKTVLAGVAAAALTAAGGQALAQHSGHFGGSGSHVSSGGHVGASHSGGFAGYRGGSFAHSGGYSGWRGGSGGWRGGGWRGGYGGWGLGFGLGLGFGYPWYAWNYPAYGWYDPYDWYPDYGYGDGGYGAPPPPQEYGPPQGQGGYGPPPASAYGCDGWRWDARAGKYVPAKVSCD